MRKDQIPQFVAEVIATGCPISVVGHDMYVLAEIDLPEEEVYRVAGEVQEICDRYGDRDRLLLDIVAHLRSLGRYVEIEYPSVHWASVPEAHTPGGMMQSGKTRLNLLTPMA